MIINKINPPWVKSGQKRYNPDPFYQSQIWKRTKQSFKQGITELPDGRIVSNMMCIECFKEGINKPGHSIDHIIRVKDGGSRTDHSNLQNLCEHHHAVKSAKEAQI